MPFYPKETPYRRTKKTKPPPRKVVKRYAPSKKAKISKAVKKELTSIKKSLASDQAIHTYRRRDTTSVGCNVNEVANSTFYGYDTTTVESETANLRYYDPGTNALVTNNVGTNTYNQLIHFKSCHDKVTVRNNYQVPAQVTLYVATPRSDTSISPTSFYSNGIADQVVGSGAVTSPLLYLSDMKDVTSNWFMKVKGKKLLQPGQQMVASHEFGSFDYNPSQVDTHNLSYQKKYKGHVWVIRIEGCIAHDTSAAEYTTTAAQVDVVTDRKRVITYDAGSSLEDFSYANNASSSFTNAGVLSNKPVSDNQSFSVA